jgi:small conductance mechanosensitive channel
MSELPSWLAVLLPQVIAALLLAIAGLWLARLGESALARFLDRHRLLEPTFRGILTALVRYSILMLAVIAALQQLGIQTTSILAAVGAVFVAIGLALQGTLSNFAAGVMLLWLRPFRIGDAIESASVSGTVTNVGFFATEIQRSDGVYVVAPNSDLWTKPLSNLSRMPSRMIELKVPLKRDTDIRAVRDQLLAIAQSHEIVHKTPAPTVFVSGMTEGGVVLSLIVWVDTPRFGQTSHELAERAAISLAGS